MPLADSFTAEAVILLDTCAAIWLADKAPLSGPSRAASDAAARRGEVYVSPVSGWEIGMLAARRGVMFAPSPRVWFDRLLALPGLRLLALAPGTAIDASFLPGKPPEDPADRLLIAAARETSAALVTRDRRILDYAKAGHLHAIAC